MTEQAGEVGRSRERAQIVESVARVMLSGEEMDQDARDAARDAMGKIASHEAVCTERWAQQRIAMKAIELSMDHMRKSLELMANRYIPPLPGAMIAGLMGLCGWLAARAFPLH